MDVEGTIDTESKLREILQLLPVKDEDINPIVESWGVLSVEQRKSAWFTLYGFAIMNAFERKVLVEHNKFALEEFLERRHREKQENIEHLLTESLSEKERKFIRDSERKIWESLQRFQRMIREGRKLRIVIAYYVFGNRMAKFLKGFPESNNWIWMQNEQRERGGLGFEKTLNGLLGKNRESIVDLLNDRLFVEIEDARTIAHFLGDLPEGQRRSIGEKLSRFVLSCLIERRAITFTFKE